jgi:alpha-glucosidase (family GH31 glycosyl hydrolase)
LILDSTTGKPITGKVYDDSVFMDWLNSKSQDIWNTALDGFRKVLTFDGLSLDFNENTVFVNNKNMSEETACNSKGQFLEDTNQNWYTQCP